MKTLAGGGKGTVYLGREEDSEEVVAIKFMHPGHLGETLYLDALRREANLAARLGHPYTVIYFTPLPGERLS